MSEQPTTLPVCERFHSLQGEGTWVGTPMHFIRLAGCNVGRHPQQVEWETGQSTHFPILKTGRTAFVCHTYDNRRFLCDTDFQRIEERPTFDALLDDTWEHHVCITGGEPLLHADALEPFIAECLRRSITPHVETSGTINRFLSAWLCVSPKLGFIPEVIDMANEVKLLVDPKFELAAVPECIRNHPNVFVQPINSELSVDPSCLKLAMEVLRVKPEWKLSCQLHKFINVR